MQIPTEITFHKIEHSEAVEASVRRWIARLEHIYDRIIKCSVTIAHPHKRHRHGGEFHINVVIEVPGGEIAATHIGHHEDIYVAVADAFRAARRQLQNHVDIQRGDVKTHLVERRGHIGVNLAKHRADVEGEGAPER
jgi:ribosomal subunit interface protein